MFTTLDQYSITLNELYDSCVRANFTETQALELAKHQMTIDNLAGKLELILLEVMDDGEPG